MFKKKKVTKEFKTLHLFLITFIILGIVVYIMYLATNQIFFENTTGQSAIDGYSIYHFVGGILICSLFLMILSRHVKKGNIIFVILLAFILTSMLGVIFEMVENANFIVESDFKYNNKADSLLNLTIDIILVILGATLVCYIYWKVLKDKRMYRNGNKYEKIKRR